MLSSQEMTKAGFYTISKTVDLRYSQRLVCKDFIMFKRPEEELIMAVLAAFMVVLTYFAASYFWCAIAYCLVDLHAYADLGGSFVFVMAAGSHSPDLAFVSRVAERMLVAAVGLVCRE